MVPLRRSDPRIGHDPDPGAIATAILARREIGDVGGPVTDRLDAICTPTPSPPHGHPGWRQLSVSNRLIITALLLHESAALCYPLRPSPSLRPLNKLINESDKWN